MKALHRHQNWSANWRIQAPGRSTRSSWHAKMQDFHFGCRTGGPFGGPPHPTTGPVSVVAARGPPKDPPLRQQPTHLCKQSSKTTCLGGGSLRRPPAATAGPGSVVAVGGLSGYPPLATRRQAHNTFCVVSLQLSNTFDPC